jgi:hypothetical protein
MGPLSPGKREEVRAFPLVKQGEFRGMDQLAPAPRFGINNDCPSFALERANDQPGIVLGPLNCARMSHVTPPLSMRRTYRTHDAHHTL